MADREDSRGSTFDAGSLGSLSLGSLGEDTLGARNLDAPLLGDQLTSDFDVNKHIGELFTSAVEVVEALPIGPATMTCVRGPCVHQWKIVQRASMQSEVTEIQRTQLCTRHVELQNLVDENVLECGAWWPAPLAFVPESLRAVLRPLLHRVWDRYLEARGNDYSWRWWPRDPWSVDKDTLHQLRTAAIKKHRAEREARRLKPPRPPIAATHAKNEKEE